MVQIGVNQKIQMLGIGLRSVETWISTGLILFKLDPIYLEMIFFFYDMDIPVVFFTLQDYFLMQMHDLATIVH